MDCLSRNLPTTCRQLCRRVFRPFIADKQQVTKPADKKGGWGGLWRGVPPCLSVGGFILLNIYLLYIINKIRIPAPQKPADKAVGGFCYNQKALLKQNQHITTKSGQKTL
jgi:hypothetical protein